MFEFAPPAGPPLRLGGRLLPIVGRARMYICGITPYDTTHLGHARTFVWADVLARVLRGRCRTGCPPGAPPWSAPGVKQAAGRGGRGGSSRWRT